MRMTYFLNVIGFLFIALALVIVVTAHVDVKLFGLLAGAAGVLVFLATHTARR